MMKDMENRSQMDLLQIANSLYEDGGSIKDLESQHFSTEIKSMIVSPEILNGSSRQYCIVKDENLIYFNKDGGIFSFMSFSLRYYNIHLTTNNRNNSMIINLIKDDGCRVVSFEVDEENADKWMKMLNNEYKLTTNDEYSKPPLPVPLNINSSPVFPKQNNSALEKKQNQPVNGDSVVPNITNKDGSYIDLEPSDNLIEQNPISPNRSPKPHRNKSPLIVKKDKEGIYAKIFGSKEAQLIGKQNIDQSVIKKENVETGNYSKISTSDVASDVMVEYNVIGFVESYRKKFACIREKNLELFNQELDVKAYQMFPLNIYNIYLSPYKDNVDDMLVKLQLKGGEEKKFNLKFYIAKIYAEKWANLFKRDFKSSTIDDYTGPPLIAPRPLSSGPPLTAPRPLSSGLPLTAPRPSLDETSQTTIKSSNGPNGNSTSHKRVSTPDILKCGILKVFDKIKNTWTSPKICYVQSGYFQAFIGGKDKTEEATKIDLCGCDVIKHVDDDKQFTIVKNKQELIRLQGVTSDETNEWMEYLLCEISTTDDDVDMMTSLEGNYVEANSVTNLIRRGFYKKSIYVNKKLKLTKNLNKQEITTEDNIHNYEEMIISPTSSNDDDDEIHLMKRRPHSRTFPDVFHNDVTTYDVTTQSRHSRSETSSTAAHQLNSSINSIDRNLLVRKRDQFDQLIDVRRVKEKELTKYYDESVIWGISQASTKVKQAIDYNKIELERLLNIRHSINSQLEELSAMKTINSINQNEQIATPSGQNDEIISTTAKIQNTESSNQSHINFRNAFKTFSQPHSSTQQDIDNEKNHDQSKSRANSLQMLKNKFEDNPGSSPKQMNEFPLKKNSLESLRNKFEISSTSNRSQTLERPLSSSGVTPTKHYNSLKIPGKTEGNYNNLHH